MVSAKCSKPPPAAAGLRPPPPSKVRASTVSRMVTMRCAFVCHGRCARGRGRDRLCGRALAGTHVASLVGGVRYGVAKNLTLVSVQTLDCGVNGGRPRGTGGDLISGIEWGIEDARSTHADKPIVFVMSLQLSGKSAILESVLQKARSAGVSIFAAAGNTAIDSCTKDPAASTAVVTVGASDDRDHIASFSSYGPCVNVFVPGVQSRAASAKSDTASSNMTGERTERTFHSPS